MFRLLPFSARAWTRRAAAIVLAAAILAVPAASTAEPRTQDKLKAEFLYRFVKFVSWPFEALPSLQGRVVFCVTGGSPFTAVLRDLMADRQIKDRAIEVRQIDAADSVRECHVLFAAADSDEYVASLLAEARDHSILTVGETESFYANGGIIRFVLSGGRLRFDVNAAAAGAANLRINSQLLQLARNVDR